MGSRVVFLFYHGIGHINPCFPLASILANEGHEVFFAGVEFFRPHITKERFNFYALHSVPFGLGFETWINTVAKKKNIFSATLSDRVTDRLYLRREADLEKMLNDISPDVVLLDGTQATDFIALFHQLKSRGIKVALIHAMFPSHVLPGRPPINSDALPEEKAEVSRAILKMKWRATKKALLQKIRFLGFDDHYIIKRRLKRNQIPTDFRSRISSLFYFMPRINSFILAPREFDFPYFEDDAMHQYVGFGLNPNRQMSMSEHYLHCRIDIAKLKNTGSKIVYCSFGTVESDHQKLIHTFLIKLFRVVRSEKLILILSLPSSLPEQSTHDTDFIFRFDTVPQQDVLTYCDLFITHGGLSSIKESIDAEVPMLMYPVHSDFDPKGNAARVAYHGLGLRGSAATDTESMVQTKINELLTDPRFKKNLKMMKRYNETYTKELFLDRFNRLSPLN